MVLATSQQEFSDADFAVVDNGDQSKKLKFEVSGIATATTRTWTVPDSDVTISSFAATLLDDLSAAAARTTLGLGTAAVENIGTSGATVPLLNAANTWSATQQFNAAVNIGNFTLSLGTFSDTGATRGYTNVNGIMQQSVEFTSTAQLQRFYNPNGLVGQITCNASATTYATSSDYRLKSDIEPLVEFSLSEEDFATLPDTLLRIMSVRPVKHKWRVDPNGPWSHGFIAHELQAAYPQAVTGYRDATEAVGTVRLSAGKTLTGVAQSEAPDGSSWKQTGERIVPQGIDPSKLVADLTASVQSLALMLLEANRRIAALEAARIAQRPSKT